MRENIGLFKAKDIKTKEWREGYYWTNEVGNHFIRVVRDKNNNFITPIDYEIDPETLCECTGLKDKNGKLIFENDKLLVRYGCEQMDISEGTYEHFVKYEKTGHGSQIGFLNGLPYTGYLEVIGNKFDK